MRKTAIFRNNLFIGHEPGFDHLDSPDRVKTLFADFDSLSEKYGLIEPNFNKISREMLLLEKILIVDWDVHHGNGTQNSFYDTDKVFFISIHQSPLYPNTGNLLETGVGKGEGYTINIPLPGGQGDMEYANIFNTLILPPASLYKPELILISAGFDAHNGDDISSMRLTYRGFAYMMRVLLTLAEDLCGGKILVSLEGGYCLDGLREGVFSVMSELVGEKLDTPFSTYLDKETEQQLSAARSPHPAIERAREVAKNYWKL